MDTKYNFIKKIFTHYKLYKNNIHKIITRFPPEPNGHLHIGHIKSMYLNFELAKALNGYCYLRFDDTNPTKETQNFVNSIIEDIKWLGFKWEKITYSSDYYQILYECAIDLIKQGKAYVDSLSINEIRKYRGTLKKSGVNSPYRNRSISENLYLFNKMKCGHFPDESHVLRARIDMYSGNINLRDPILYRIRHVSHHRTGETWCIYPMYDYAHTISDLIEEITYSLCTLEFQDHKPLYNWFLNNIQIFFNNKPMQIEFSKLNISYTVTSKRLLKNLIDKNIISGWDDPRLLTICGMRKRGYPPKAILRFCENIGISRQDSVIDIELLESYVRDELNKISKRAFCILNPLKVIIKNYPDNKIEKIKIHSNVKNLSSERYIIFSREIYIDKNDFMEFPIKNYFRLSLGSEVRLRHAYIIKCIDFVCNNNGNIMELHCIYDKKTLGKNPIDRKVKGVIHWISCFDTYPVNIIHYNRLFNNSTPNKRNFCKYINPNSLHVSKALCESYLSKQPLNKVFQFERLGYYCVHEIENSRTISFHNVVDLVNTWNKR